MRRVAGNIIYAAACVFLAGMISLCMQVPLTGVAGGFLALSMGVVVYLVGRDISVTLKSG